MKKICLAALLCVAAGLAACGTNDDPTVTDSGGETSSSEVGDTHNAADIAFAQGMIPHHQQAIDMSNQVLERGEAPSVKDLAQRIKGDQSEEIDLMRGWLAEWGEEEVDHGSDDPSMDMGTMPQEDMEALAQTSGRDLDKMFLEMMIPHHEGAIAMAETELADGEFADALALAERIVDAQKAEISEIQGLLAGLE